MTRESSPRLTHPRLAPHLPARQRNKRTKQPGYRGRQRTVRAKPPERLNNAVFLNIPYDERFSRLYLAYISGLIHLGLDPRATVEISGGQNRLEKILDLIRSCRYSIHDLSRVQLDGVRPRTPRFNMPFELGLAVASAKLDSAPHTWFVFESVTRRAAKSLSDLSGTDPHIHRETIEGVMREIGNAFVRRSSRDRYSVTEMMKTYRAVSRRVKEIQRETRAESLFEARVFRLLCTTARAASHTS
jgi:hypothetical protein